jgi:putative transposase
VTQALQMALGRRQPKAGTLHHSDRGREYTSAEYQSLLALKLFDVSMSRAGNCYDNAPMESFFGTLKAELIYRRRYQTREEARQDIIQYIEGYYNATRRHSALGYRSSRVRTAYGLTSRPQNGGNISPTLLYFCELWS